LSKLEREAGAILATRTYAGVELTAEGRALLTHVDAILKRLAIAEQAVQDIAQLRSSEVRLGSFTSGALILLAPTIATFNVTHPAVRLSLAEVEPPDGYDNVRTGDFDLLLSHVYPGLTAPDPEGLVTEELFADPLVAVLPENWLASEGSEPLPVERLAEVPLISGSPGHANRIALERMLSETGAITRIEFETRDYAVTLALVAAGAGATVMPSSIMASTDPPMVRIRSLENTEARKVLVVHRPMPPETPAMSFLEILRQTSTALIEKLGTPINP
jgi:DNA-binding transcriptional LysR family regulator